MLFSNLCSLLVTFVFSIYLESGEVRVSLTFFVAWKGLSAKVTKTKNWKIEIFHTAIIIIPKVRVCGHFEKCMNESTLSEGRLEQFLTKVMNDGSTLLK